MPASASAAVLENMADDVECECAIISDEDNVYESKMAVIHKTFLRVN